VYLKLANLWREMAYAAEQEAGALSQETAVVIAFPSNSLRLSRWKRHRFNCIRSLLRAKKGMLAIAKEVGVGSGTVQRIARESGKGAATAAQWPRSLA
jgi:tetrahydromethanopterin S-methyltransferase subunit H